MTEIISIALFSLILASAGGFGFSRKIRRIIYKKYYKRFLTFYDQELITATKEVTSEPTHLGLVDFIYLNDKLRDSIKTVEQILGTDYVQIHAKVKRISAMRRSKALIITLTKKLFPWNLSAITTDKVFCASLDKGNIIAIHGKLKVNKDMYDVIDYQIEMDD